MRILGFSQHWSKLDNAEFTTFRFPWSNGFEFRVGDKVQIVITPRSPKRVVLGVAEIIGADWRRIDDTFLINSGYPLITEEEAMKDGFTSRDDMQAWLRKAYGDHAGQPMLKYTLKVIK